MGDFTVSKIEGYYCKILLFNQMYYFTVYCKI